MSHMTLHVDFIWISKFLNVLCALLADIWRKLNWLLDSQTTTTRKNQLIYTIYIYIYIK